MTTLCYSRSELSQFTLANRCDITTSLATLTPHSIVVVGLNQNFTRQCHKYEKKNKDKF